MAVPLYDLSVGCYLQTLGAVSGYLERGLAHCTENNIDPAEIVETRLFHDMQPFRFQILSVAQHSLGAVEAIRRGVFSPPAESALDYRGLQALIADARAALEKVQPGEINAREGAEVLFQVRDFKIAFRAEEFVMSFSLPNLHFHATTAYDILRSKGAPIGKRDYLGQLRVKR